MRMLSFTFAGHAYQTPVLNAFEQFSCLQALLPVQDRMRPPSRGAAPLSGSLDLLARAVNALPPDTAERLFGLCLPPLKRLDDEWRPVWDADAGQSPFADLGVVALMSLVGRVIVENLRSYIERTPLDFDPIKGRLQDYPPVVLPNGQSWLLRPVEAGMCRFESLLDGTLDLGHLALMNDAIAARAENEARAHKAAQEDTP